MVTKIKSIMEFAGAWKTLSEEEIVDMANLIETLRKEFTRDIINNNSY